MSASICRGGSPVVPTDALANRSKDCNSIVWPLASSTMSGSSRTNGDRTAYYLAVVQGQLLDHELRRKVRMRAGESTGRASATVSLTGRGRPARAFAIGAITSCGKLATRSSLWASAAVGLFGPGTFQ